MKAQYESQLYELDRIAEAFASILTAAKVANVSWNRARGVHGTPRVDIFMTVETNEGHRFPRNPTEPSSAAQPYDVWNARFEVDVVTNRTTNPAEARKLIGIVRYHFQLWVIQTLWTEAVSPYHEIVSMIEAAEQMEMDNEDNTDAVRMVFEGMVKIRDDAWPIPAPPFFGSPQLFDLVSGETFLLESGDNFVLVANG